MARTPTADGPPHPASAATGRTTAHEQAPALRARGVVKEWDVRVLHGIDLEVPAGQHLATTGDGRQHRMDGGGDGFAQGFGGLVLQVRTLDEMRLDTVLEHGGR